MVLLDFKKIVMNWSRPPFHPQQGGGGGGGGLPYGRDSDARQKF